MGLFLNSMSELMDECYVTSLFELNAFISYRYAHDSRTNMKKNKRQQQKITRKRH